ncbi:MAG: putative membrane protein, partial [uncultured Nocardioidaceae bacterium]
PRRGSRGRRRRTWGGPGGQLHRAPGTAGRPRGGRRRLGTGPADRAPRVQRRRRRGGGDLAGRHAVLPGPHRRGARPGRPLPRPDDAPLRDRGAPDRAVPRPVQPRPPLGDRQHHGDPRVPVLGARHGGGHRVELAVPRRAGLPGGLQGVRRDAGRRGAATAAARPDPGQGQRPGLHGRHRRRRRLGSHRGPRVHGGVGVVAALRVRALRGRHGPRDPAARAGGLEPRRGHARADARPLRPRAGARQATADPHPVGGRLRAAGQLRPPLALGLPHDVHGVPAARQPHRRLEAGGPARAGHRRRGARQHARHRHRVADPPHQPRRHRRPRPARRRSRGAARRAVLRAADPRAARPHGRPRPVAGQAVAGLHHPERRARAHPGERLRALRHHAPAGLGDRRVRRHRHAPHAPPGPRGGVRRARGLGHLRPPHAARPDRHLAGRRL